MCYKPTKIEVVKPHEGVEVQEGSGQTPKPDPRTRDPLIFLKDAFPRGCAGLHCCVWAFSSCGGGGCSGARAPHRSGFSRCGAQALGTQASVLVEHGLGCSAACGIFLDQGLNLCALHWQTDSQPLDHEGSLPIGF